ncbi:MAG: hypothetical protein ACRC9P_02880 [Bacteroides sp.]
MKKNSLNIITAILLVIWMLITILLIYKNVNIRSKLDKKEVVIENLRSKIHMLRFSNHSYEEYFKKKVLDGEMIEIIAIEEE